MKYFHHGSDKVTIGPNGHTIYNKGTLDMRSGVGLLSRRIKFTSSDEDNWGASLVTYFYKKIDKDHPEKNVFNKGLTKLTGVEVTKMSKLNTESAALDFYHLLLV